MRHPRSARRAHGVPIRSGHQRPPAAAPDHPTAEPANRPGPDATRAPSGRLRRRARPATSRCSWPSSAAPRSGSRSSVSRGSGLASPTRCSHRMRRPAGRRAASTPATESRRLRRQPRRRRWRAGRPIRRVRVDATASHRATRGRARWVRPAIARASAPGPRHARGRSRPENSRTPRASRRRSECRRPGIAGATRRRGRGRSRPSSARGWPRGRRAARPAPPRKSAWQPTRTKLAPPTRREHEPAPACPRSGGRARPRRERARPRTTT